MEGKDLVPSNNGCASRDTLVTAFFAYGQHALNYPDGCRHFLEKFSRCVGEYRIVDVNPDGSFSVVCDDGSKVAFTPQDPYCMDLYAFLMQNNI